MTPHKNIFEENAAAHTAEDDFLLREGLDLNVAYRAITNEGLRRSILVMIMTLAATEQDGRFSQRERDTSQSSADDAVPLPAALSNASQQIG